jgi:hypothetical protein
MRRRRRQPTLSVRQPHGEPQQPLTYRTYQLIFHGRAVEPLRAEFDDYQITVGPSTTTLRAELPDQPALFGLIQRAFRLGLPFLGVIRERPNPHEYGSGDRPSPDDPRDIFLPETRRPDFQSSLVNRLSSIGQALEDVRDRIEDDGARRRLGAAIEQLDRTIRDIHTTVPNQVRPPLRQKSSAPSEAAQLCDMR